MRERLSHMLSCTRSAANFTQEEIAHVMDVSRQSVINWETGKKEPLFRTVMEWLYVCHQPVYPYIMEFLHPRQIVKPSLCYTNTQIEQSLILCIKELPCDMQAKLLFLISEKHYHNLPAVLDMICAYLHTPMDRRLNIATNICTNYEYSQRHGILNYTDEIMPDMENLKYTIQQGREAVFEQ